MVLNRWRVLCPSCFYALAKQAGVRYSFVDLEGQSWSDRPQPRNPHKRRRQTITPSTAQQAPDAATMMEDEHRGAIGETKVARQG